MSTRSNVIVVSADGNHVDQFYHHWDGYLSGVGEELRKHLLYSIGINSLVKDMSVYDILIGELSDCDGYEFEDSWALSDHNHLHADIEFTYVIRDNNLYFAYEWDICHKVATYKDLIDYVCKDSNKIDLTHRLTDEDDQKLGD